MTNVSDNNITSQVNPTNLLGIVIILYIIYLWFLDESNTITRTLNTETIQLGVSRVNYVLHGFVQDSVTWAYMAILYSVYVRNAAITV